MTDLARDKDVLEHAYKLFYDELALCGCGEPGKGMKLVYDLLKLTPFYVDGNYAKAEELIGTPGAVHIVLSTLEDAGLTEHGPSMIGTWITDKGRWLVWAIDHIVSLDGLDDRLSEFGYPHDGGDCTDQCWKITTGATKECS